MNMKYVNKPKESYDTPFGRRVDPSKWKTGPCAITRDKYYAWLKHRSQAKFRGEDYHLTWEDWQDFWIPENWSNRGRGNENVCLRRISLSGPWSKDNCEIVQMRFHRKVNKRDS